MYLDIMVIYKYVDASTPKPTDTPQLATWTRNDYTTKAAIMSFLSEDSICLAIDAPIVQDSCKAVEEHGDLPNSSTLY